MTAPWTILPIEPRQLTPEQWEQVFTLNDANAPMLAFQKRMGCRPHIKDASFKIALSALES